eukprot:3738990-Alexandrium_andersonii.AAC.1
MACERRREERVAASCACLGDCCPPPGPWQLTRGRSRLVAAFSARRHAHFFVCVSARGPVLECLIAS